MKSSKDKHLEIEVKFSIADRGVFRRILLEVGAEEVSPRTYEKNIRFDTPRERLKQEGKLLRLRHDALSRLTFKGESSKDVDSEARVREELEVTVDDFNTMALILERVGFVRSQIYEKYRETYQLEEVEIVIDEMPFGDFVELEGDDRDLQAAARKLGLDWNRRILANYLALMEIIKNRYNLPFDDVTFENFEGRDISVADFIDSEELGIARDY